MTGGSNNCTGNICQQEAAEEPPQDHTSDQEESEDKESLSEVNQRADTLKFIREFQEIMNKAIEQFVVMKNMHFILYHLYKKQRN